MPSQRYAIDGAIQIKSVEENEPELGVIPVTVTNEQDGGSSSLLLQMNKKDNMLPYCYK